MNVVIAEFDEGALPLLHEYKVTILEVYDKSSVEERAAIFLLKELTKSYRVDRAKLTDKLEAIREKNNGESN